ncbi:hypothetical protein CLU79DRAFT_845562 [Phycomyces nitens]|nr:hypothetical protein CLU79DRAFT_845562 [Phycomyces nitens]
MCTHNHERLQSKLGCTMTHQSPQRQRQHSSAFEWPIPSSPLAKAPSHAELTEISLKEILTSYQDDPELLKHVLAAKTAENKKRVASLTLKAEMARIQLRSMDFDILHEQSRHPHHPGRPLEPQSAFYSGLAPIQKQVIARFANTSDHSRHAFSIPPFADPYSARPPVSPIYYPHSAHPLCRPEKPSHPTFASSPTLTRPHNQSHHLAHIIHLPEPEPLVFPKRSRASFSAIEQQVAAVPSYTGHQKPSHNEVMEALKAKIQRSNGSSSAFSKARRLSCIEPNERSTIYKQRTHSRHSQLPALRLRHVKYANERVSVEPLTPSPGSDKPVLPPIDTSLGRKDGSPKSLKELDQSPKSIIYTTPSPHSTVDPPQPPFLEPQ